MCYVVLRTISVEYGIRPYRVKYKLSHFRLWAQPLVTGDSGTARTGHHYTNCWKLDGIGHIDIMNLISMDVGR